VKIFVTVPAHDGEPDQLWYSTDDSTMTQSYDPKDRAKLLAKGYRELSYYEAEDMKVMDKTMFKTAPPRPEPPVVDEPTPDPIESA